MAMQDIELPFPINGLNRSFALIRQNAETTPHTENVLPYDVLEHRFRGGSRPGFAQLSNLNMGGPPVFMVSFPSPPVEGESYRPSFIAGTENDLFVNLPGKSVVDGQIVYTESFVSLASYLQTEEAGTEEDVGYIRPDGVSMYLRPGGDGAYHQPGSGVSNVLLTEDGEPLEAASFSFGGQRTVATQYKGVVVIPGSGEVILEGTGRLVDGVLVGDRIADWRAEGAKTLDHIVELAPLPGSSLTPASYAIRFDNGRRLYVDSGTNGGRCSFRVVDGPKAISAVNRSVSPLESHLGNIPTGADLVTTYLDRLVFVKDRIWYMSRQGDSGDYDYGADAGDRGRAVAGVTSDAGLPGDPIVAMASRGNDYLVMFAAETTWVMRGDPAANGVLFNLSRKYGCVDPQSWCHGDAGELYFLSKEGLCVIQDGMQARPEPISTVSVPNDLRNVDRDQYSVSMVFDTRYRGVWIFLTPRNGGNSQHWWYSKLGNSFWPITFASESMQPTAATIHASSPADNSFVLIGDTSGILRRAVPGLGDGNSPIASEIILGPYLSAGTAWRDGLLVRIAAMLGGTDSAVTLAVYGGNSPEEATARATSNSTPDYEVSISGLRTNTFRPRVRCVAFCVGIRSSSAWVFESLITSFGAAGAARL